MMHVTMRQLQVFEAVARLKSFSRAAEEMQISQPTASKLIRQLHEEIGLALLEQLGKKVFLTEAGEQLYATCSEWLQAWTRFEQGIANLKGLKEGQLKIATVTTTKYFMPRILGPFAKAYPGIGIALEMVSRSVLLDRLAHNMDDMYIMGLPPEDFDGECIPFMQNPLVIIAPAGHPLAGRKQLDFRELASEPFIVREQGSGTRITVERIFAEHQCPLKIRIELSSNIAIRQAVAGGLGLALLSSSALTQDATAREVTVLDVTGFPVMGSWYLLRPKGKQPSVAAQTFEQFLRQHTDLLVPAGENPAI